MNGNERDSSRRRSILFVSIGLIVVALAGLILGTGFKSEPSSSPLQSKTRTTSSTKMEKVQVGKKQTLPKDISRPTPSDGDDSGGYFTLVSMNLAGFVPSQMAPESWTQRNSIDAVKAIILSHRPDWIALQEARGSLDMIDQEFEDYKAVGVTHSHADQVVLLVKKEMEAKLIPTPRLPVVMAELKLGEHRLLAASVHLEPFQNGFAKRAKQMRAVQEEADSVSLPVVIAGDTNMRPTEDEVMEEELQLLDVWKLAGSNPRTQFTWDTIDHRNQEREEGESEGYFNQYYGESTRQYTARYDRIYIHHGNSSIEVANNDSSPVTFDLIANEPMTSKLDFLSDHFGVVSKLPIQWK